MRKLFSFNLVSLDGLFEGPQQDDIGWQNVDDEFNEFAAEQLETVGVILFGRVTYQGMASFWPTPFAIENDPVIADQMNRFPKIVVSRTLDKADWNNTRLIKDNVAEEITRLKQQPGNDLAIFGSANLTASLMQLGLVDEFRIMVNPIILGSGTPLFNSVHLPLKLQLLKTRTFRSGNVLLYYQTTAMS
jgi:dihydrofolate reductase